jgi:tetratricopeptide (TPR) repeat protein
VDSLDVGAEEKARVVAGCYELLLVLAEARAQSLPGQGFDEQRDRASAAVRSLDRAARLGLVTRAWHLRRAHYLARAGDAPAAQRERERAAAVQPGSALDFFFVGDEHYRQGRWKEAAENFESALQLEPDHFWAQYYLALCRLKARRPDLAAAVLTACLGRRPDFAWLYVLRGSAHAEQGQFTAAAADFERAEKCPLDDAARYGLLVNRGVLRVRQGQADEAVSDLRAAITLKPAQYQGYVNLAQAYVKQGKLDKATRQLDLAIDKEGSLAALYRTRAQVQLQRQNLESALRDFDKAVELEGPLSPATADDHLERGRIFHRRKDYAAAVRAYDAAVLLRPEHAPSHRLRAEALLELNRFAESLGSLDVCVRQGPPEAEVLRARAGVRARLGQYTGAQADYTRALELAPDAATHAARGWLYMVAESPKLALADFTEAIRLDPSAGDAYVGRAHVRATQGRLRPALTDAEEGLRRGPESPRLLYNTARVYALGVGLLDAPESRGSVQAAETRADCQARAVRLLTRALDLLPPGQRSAFWQNYVHNDHVLDPIRQGGGFVQLAALYVRAAAEGGGAP